MITPFSERHGYETPAPPITAREDAPDGLRSYLVDTAYRAGYTAEQAREVVCAVLYVPKDPSAWSHDRIDSEVRGKLEECAWFRVYDVVEALCAPTTKSRVPAASPGKFSQDMNRYFAENGIGWQIIDGEVVVRGEQPYELTLRDAHASLEAAGYETARNELREAIRDLSRRPNPDVTGAIQHAGAAMECVARDVAGDRNAAFGDIAKRRPELLPKPLDVAVEKAWGYTSNRARHIQEGDKPSLREAKLVVGICAVICQYLALQDGRM